MADVQAVSDALARSSVFAALTPERRARLAAGGAAVEQAAGAVLFLQGDDGDAVYAVLSGALEVTIAHEDGRVAVLASLGPGDLVGEMGALTGHPRSADVHAARRSHLWRIGRPAVVEALEAEGRAAMALVGVLADRLREADALVVRTRWTDVAGRLAGALLETPGRPVTLSQGGLGRLIGASREAVNRRLSDWRRAGWVELDGRGLHVRDADALRALADGRPPPLP